MRAFGPSVARARERIRHVAELAERAIDPRGDEPRDERGEHRHDRIEHQRPGPDSALERRWTAAGYVTRTARAWCSRG